MKSTMWLLSGIIPFQTTTVHGRRDSYGLIRSTTAPESPWHSTWEYVQARSCRCEPAYREEYFLRSSLSSPFPACRSRLCRRARRCHAEKPDGECLGGTRLHLRLLEKRRRDHGALGHRRPHRPSRALLRQSLVSAPPVVVSLDPSMCNRACNSPARPAGIP